MPSPVARIQLSGCDLLHHVAGELVEDGEEGLVSEIAHAGVERGDVIHAVGGGELEFGDRGS